MNITSALDYAYRATLVLSGAPDPGTPVTSSEIASDQHLSEGFLLQVLGMLRRAGIVDSVRGKHGGYLLARPPREITVADLVMAVEGDKLRADAPANGNGRSFSGRGLVMAVDAANQVTAERLAEFDIESLKMEELTPEGDMYVI